MNAGEARRSFRPVRRRISKDDQGGQNCVCRPVAVLGLRVRNVGFTWAQQNARRHV